MTHFIVGLALFSFAAIYYNINTEVSITFAFNRVEPESEALQGGRLIIDSAVKCKGHEVWTVLGTSPLVTIHLPTTSR